MKALDKIYKIYTLCTLLHRSAFKNSAKFRQAFSDVCSVTNKTTFILKCLFMFCNYGPHFTNFDLKNSEFQKSVRKRSKSPRFFSNFLGFRNECF